MPWYIIVVLLINNGILLIPKNSRPSIQDVYYWGQYNQSCKVQWSIKSQNEPKEEQPITDIQSNKVQRKI